METNYKKGLVNWSAMADNLKIQGSWNSRYGKDVMFLCSDLMLRDSARNKTREFKCQK